MSEIQFVKLEGGAEVKVNFAFKGRCRKCKKGIFWGITSSGKWMPISVDENNKLISHFADCEFASEFRKK